ncbi:hypothetical protein, partial [Bacillus sp. FJAT-28004]|uniref:hypothetical protein n=1 Tax=Bacillus sp. FJAT-28004 TaxID=1679165 RepID=UPI000B15ACBE
EYPSNVAVIARFAMQVLVVQGYARRDGVRRKGTLARQGSEWQAKMTDCVRGKDTAVENIQEHSSLRRPFIAKFTGALIFGQGARA